MTKNIRELLRSEILGSKAQVQGPDPGSRSRVQTMARTASDWSSRPASRILSIRYTGLEGLPVASDILRLDRPRIGYARLLVARNVPNHSTILDYSSVITLGHTSKEPLMRPRSELVDGSEPHGSIPQSARQSRPLSRE